MRIVFMGTPDYAVASLEALVQAGHQVVGVVTQPDRPRGRGGRMQAPPAKLCAQRHGIPVYQPERLRRDGIPMLKALKPDLCVTAAFGQILSQEALDIPPMGTVNVHASLLPRYRGSAPINWCIIEGEAETGVTTMMTDRGIDTGDILMQKRLAILPQETAGELTPRLAQLGAGLLVETIAALQRGDCPRTPQDEAQSSYHPMLEKAMGEVDWGKGARALSNLIRGLNPWPAAYTDSPLGRIKLLRAEPQEGHGGQPGLILKADGRHGLLVQTGDGALLVTQLQAQGGRAMDARDYLRGHPMEEGSLLGRPAGEERA